MLREDFLFFKANLLCYGMKIDENVRQGLREEYPHFFDKGFIHATNISVLGSNICVSIADDYSMHSKYVLYKENDKYYIKDGEGRAVRVKFFGALPSTSLPLDGSAQLHAPGCINIWPSSACCYDADGQKCKFCSLKKDKNEPVCMDLLTEYIKRLLSQLDNTHMINMSGGTYKNPDYMVGYYIEVVKKIRQFSDCKIAIEFAPPTDLTLIEKLGEAGCDVGIINLEIANNERRKMLCPGKGNIPYEHYYAALQKAVDVFGHGMVSSVLIGGIQDANDIINECENLTRIGVFPTIMPFRPFDNCQLHGFSPCDPKELIYMSEKLGEMLRKHHLSPKKQPGCTECGGCSIENDCYLLDTTVVGQF